MSDIFNPNELVLEKVRSVEEYDISTSELTGRYTQIEDPSLQTSADGTTVTDAMGAEITTFYNAQTGTFSFTNSLFSLDLAASQLGSTKEIASATNKIVVPVSETITIGSDATAALKYVPIGTEGSEVKYAKVITEENTFGVTYVAGATATAPTDTASGTFVVDAKAKTLTFPEGTTGRVFVQYERESEEAVKVTKKTDGVPETKTLLINVIFHSACNPQLVYAGVIYVPRAQINPESVELNLTADGKHSAEYKLQKPYCDEDSKLFDIIVSKD
jgi:hypothetical protein